jgi:excisionase family DNA binding protein
VLDRADGVGPGPEPGVTGTFEPAEDAALLTVDQVAMLLQVPKRWVYERAQRGDLPSGKVGKYLRFRRRDVLAYIDRQFT